jgi:hypothetical protein
LLKAALDLLTNADESISKMLQKFNFEKMLSADWAWAFRYTASGLGQSALLCLICSVNGRNKNVGS